MSRLGVQPGHQGQDFQAAVEVWVHGKEEELFYSADRIGQKLSGFMEFGLQPWQPELSQFSEFSPCHGNHLGHLQLAQLKIPKESSPE